jgi:translation initiation factor 2B subunit (eIF-2B alpha/beta/delta family)
MTETMETKEIKVGKFKTKEKLIEFIGFRGNVNFIANEATIESKYLSGLDLDNVVFKLTIYDNGTVDLDEIDTNKTTEEQRERLLDIIFEKTVVPYNQMMVIKDLPFKSVQKINDKSIDLYLSVDIKTPIMKLASIFDEEETVEVSENQNSKIEDLLSMFDDEEETPESEELAHELEGEIDEPIKTDSQKAMEESFKKMKQEKIVELKKRLEHQESELKKFNYEKSQAENKIENAKKEISVLESRIDSLQPIADPNGYCFFVSERLNEKITLDEQTAKIIYDKISKVKGINPDAFMKLFEQGEFEIKLGHKVDGQIVEFTDYENLSEDIKQYLMKNNVILRQEKNDELSTDGSIIFDKKLFYVGELTWHDIVNKMIKGGFTQEPEFDKMCGSNSYFVGFGSPTNENVEKNKIENMIKRFDEFEENEDLREEEMQEMRDEFEEVNGYPVGNDFIFSIEEDKNITNGFWVGITPKSYWDSEGYQYDGQVDLLVNIPNGFSEVQEGIFEYDGLVNDAIDALCNNGFKFHQPFQDFMLHNQKYMVNGMTLEQYIQKNYPNSIV